MLARSVTVAHQRFVALLSQGCQGILCPWLCLWQRGRFWDIDSPCVLRSVKAILAASQERAGCDLVLNVLMVTAAKTAR